MMPRVVSKNLLGRHIAAINGDNQTTGISPKILQTKSPAITSCSTVPPRQNAAIRLRRFNPCHTRTGLGACDTLIAFYLNIMSNADSLRNPRDKMRKKSLSSSNAKNK